MTHLSCYITTIYDGKIIWSRHIFREQDQNNGFTLQIKWLAKTC